jgi:hypothetical protein
VQIAIYRKLGLFAGASARKQAAEKKNKRGAIAPLF